MQKNKANRLGFANDGEEVLKHPFFQGIDLNKLMRQEIEAPFKPEVSADGLDVKYFNAKSDAKDLAETYIPEAKSRKVEKYKD